MVSLKVNISNPLKKFFDKEVLKSNHVRLTFREQLEKIVIRARQVHKYITRSGLLDRSIEQKIVSDIPLRGEVQINDQACKYGKYLHFGTKDHFIKPVESKALRFVGGNGGFFFSKGHKVSGIKENQFVGDAVKYQMPEFEKELSDAVFKEMDS